MVNSQDPAYYGELWAHDYDDEFHDFDPGLAVEALAALGDGRPVLELGVGTGRVALPLHRRGVDVQGLDASPAMVEQLRAKPGGEDLEVRVGDMASSPLGGPYGLVYLAFNTLFCLLTQQRQIDCFRNVASSLAPGGQFAIECFVPDVARFRDGNQTTRVVRLSEDSARLYATVHDPVSQTVRSQHIHIGDGAVLTRPVALRYAWPAELDLMATVAGLELVERWDGWSKGAFTARATQHVSVYGQPSPRHGSSQ